MMEGSYTMTAKCMEWLILNNKSLFLDINDKGCNGQTITWELQDYKKDMITKVGHRLASFIKNGLVFQVDYLDTPLLQGIHINVLNKEKCGCGVSFS